MIQSTRIFVPYRTGARGHQEQSPLEIPRENFESFGTQTTEGTSLSLLRFAAVFSHPKSLLSSFRHCYSHTTSLCANCTIIQDGGDTNGNKNKRFINLLGMPPKLSNTVTISKNDLLIPRITRFFSFFFSFQPLPFFLDNSLYSDWSCTFS